MIKTCFVLSLFVTNADGFGVLQPNVRPTMLSPIRPAVRAMTTVLNASGENEDIEPRDKSQAFSTAALITATTSLISSPAFAAGPDWGIFEGKTLSLLHPFMMGSLFLYSLSTGFLGLKWRRLRTMGEEITALKKTLPDLGGASTVEAAIEAAKTDENTALVSKLKTALPIQEQINTLISERKDLTSQNLRERHFNQGSFLAFLGIFFAVEGPLNTYGRTGKLFPGPHLYAGAALVVIWAAASATVPFMQKGSETARNIHIAANVAGLGLFAWQIQSGIPILLKVIEKAPWP